MRAARAQVSRMDCAVWLVTFLGCLFVSIDAGLGAGIALGLMLLFTRTAFARIGAQAPLPGAAPSYRDADLYSLQVGASPRHHILSDRPRMLPAPALHILLLCMPYICGTLECVGRAKLSVQTSLMLRAHRVALRAQGDAEAQLEGTPAVVRLGGPLCFANAARLKEHLLELVVSVARLITVHGDKRFSPFASSRPVQPVATTVCCHITAACVLP